MSIPRIAEIKFWSTAVGQGRFVDHQQSRKAFDRGVPVWPPRSNAKDDRTAPKKKHLIEAALFGRLDQKLRTIVQGTLPKKTAWVRELEGIWEPKTPAKGVC